MTLVDAICAAFDTYVAPSPGGTAPWTEHELHCAAVDEGKRCCLDPGHEARPALRKLIEDAIVEHLNKASASTPVRLKRWPTCPKCGSGQFQVRVVSVAGAETRTVRCSACGTVILDALEEGP